jgi:hypothetical protein
MADATSISSTQSNIPEWAQPYAASLLGRAEALTDINQNPYQAYAGQRVAGFSPLEQQGFQGIAGLQPSQAISAGIGYAGNVAQQAGNVPQVSTGAFNQPGVAGSYMSPYMQNVVDIQQREAQRQADIARTQRGAQAVGQGAYGGSRQAIMEAEAARNLATQKGDIQAQGLQSAYQQAQGAYMTDAQRQLQAQQLNQMAGLQGLQQQLAAAGQLGQLGQQQFGQQMGAATAQQQAGATQRSAEQQRLEAQYQDFLAQQKYPYAQLGFMSDVLRGVPSTGSVQTMYQSQSAPSFSNQLMGYGLGAYGLSKLFAKGGKVQRYAKGGVVQSNMGKGLPEAALHAVLEGEYRREA